MKDNSIQNGPVVIGGIGGSGTRVIAEILRNLNFYIGNDLNDSVDNLIYTLLFKRRKWFYKNRNNRKIIYRGLNILEKVMTGRRSFSVPEYIFILNAAVSMSRHGHNMERNGSGLWPMKRVAKIFNSVQFNIHTYAGWGWKEPNSHLLIDYMNDFFPNFKYIYATRNGLDMAFSQNQQQLFNWGPLFGVDLPKTDHDIPLASFRYWVKANRLALEKWENLGPKRFFWINYDQLCLDPKTEIRKLFSFLEVDVDEDIFRKCAELPKIASSTGRFKNHDISGFDHEDLMFLKSLNFEIY